MILRAAVAPNWIGRRTMEIAISRHIGMTLKMVLMALDTVGMALSLLTFTAVRHILPMDPVSKFRLERIPTMGTGKLMP